MKTATVRDLRNHYTKLLGWIDAGEEVAVSRRGRVIARLVPEAGKKLGRVDWRTSAAVKMDKTALPLFGVKDSATLLAESQAAS
jgi:antitoxin (DNA-binding transcriptional repressor) of toxin-antitoxin stability system